MAKNANTTQYVSHFVSSTGSGDSMAEIDLYAGYMKPMILLKN